MHTTLFSAIDLAEEVARQVGPVQSTEVVIYPPFPNLEAVHKVLAGGTIELGGQNVFWKDEGAYTGEVSPPMLRAVGCTWVLAGHSERRHLLGETNQMVNWKLHAALHSDLKVTLAVGETREERQQGRTEQVLQEQLTEGLADVSGEQMAQIVIAYEPVWAIGTGETATPEQAVEAHTFVRQVLAELCNREVAQRTRILYGGSVNAHNAQSLLSQPEIDGALVGGASLKPAEFAAIVRAAESKKAP